MDPMESVLEATGPLALLVLALIDATSMGTLVIPVILLVTGEGGALRVAGRTLLYLGVIGLFYLALGIGLLTGLLPLLVVISPWLGSAPVMFLLALAGLGLVIWSFHIAPAAIRKRGGDPEASARRIGRASCRERVEIPAHGRPVKTKRNAQERKQTTRIAREAK